jgi:hypothetical protein
MWEKCNLGDLEYPAERSHSRLQMWEKCNFNGLDYPAERSEVKVVYKCMKNVIPIVYN